MTEQHTASAGGPADVPDLDARLTALVKVWERRIAEVNFVPEGRAHARTVLDATLRRLMAALRAHRTRWLTDTIAGAPDDGRLGLCLLALDRFTGSAEGLGTQRAEALLVRVAHRLRVLAEKHGHFLAHLGEYIFAIAVPRTTSH